MTQLTALLPEFIVLGVALMLPVAYPKARGEQARLLSLIALAGTVVAGGLLLGAFGDLGAADVVPEDGVLFGHEPEGFAFAPEAPETVRLWGGYEFSPFSALFKLMVLGGTALVIMGSPTYLGRRAEHAEYYTLLLLAALGMMIVASSRDFITLFIGVETAAFSSYVLAGWFKREETSLEASTKYFITGALASTLTLFGITLLYGYTGEVTFQGLHAAWLGHGPSIIDVALDPLMVLAVLLIVAGLGFKMTVAPFHMWAPDVYTGAPDTVSAFLGGVSKALGAVALFRVFLVALLGVSASWQVLVAVLAVVTMTLGNLVAIRQDDIKRMLAYSSVAQAGYILIVLPVIAGYGLSGGSVPAEADLALQGGVFHTAVNILMKGGAFLVVAALAAGGVGYMISDYNGLARRNPWLALSLTVFLLSLAGIPPLAGFASKFVLFSSAVQGGLGPGSWMMWLAVAGILNSAVSLYYYARWIRAMYFEPPTMHPVKARVPLGATIAIGLSLLGVLYFGLFPQIALDVTAQAAAFLLP